MTQFLEPPQKGKTHLPLEGCLWAPGPPHTYPLPSYISFMLALLLLALFAPPPLAKMAHPHNTTTFFCLFLQTFRSPKCSQRQYHAAHATRGFGPACLCKFFAGPSWVEGPPGCCVLRHVAAAGVVVGGCGFAPCVVAGWWGCVVFFVAVLGGQPQAQHAENSLCVRPYYGEYT